MRPGLKPATSWFLVRFVSVCHNGAYDLDRPLKPHSPRVQTKHATSHTGNTADLPRAERATRLHLECQVHDWLQLPGVLYGEQLKLQRTLGSTKKNDCFIGGVCMGSRCPNGTSGRDLPFPASCFVSYYGCKYVPTTPGVGC